MGNSNQAQANVEMPISSYAYLDSKKLSIGISPFSIPRKPKPFFPMFDCQKCGRENFDGGLCQKVKCVCGSYSSRYGTEEISQLETRFWDCFDICQSKRYGEISELQTISIGVFERGIPSEILQNSTLNFNLVYSEYLLPFFTSKMRCISNKDLFKFNSCYFKVMSCIPDQGFVTRDTQIFCYKMLSDRNLFKIEVTPLSPHNISEEVFESLVIPYFQQVRHIHEDQKLNINGLDCVISKAEPWNGVVNRDCHIEFVPNASPNLERVKLVPYYEDLPNSLRSLEAGTLVRGIANNYLMPHLKGWARCMYPGKTMLIAGIEFKVLEASPNKGIISDSTVVYYDGKCISRREERMQARASAPRNNRLILAQILTMLDNMKQLTEEFSETLISTLPVFVLDIIPSNSEQKVCLICMNDFEIGNEVRALPCCKGYLVHIFHTECTDNWLRRNKLCPTCKTPCDGPRDYE